MKKALRCLTVTLVVLAVLVFATSCNLSENAPLAQELCRQMTDAILADDFDGAYAVVSAVCSEEEFQPIYGQLRTLLEGVGSYELKQTAFRSELKSGVETYSATYRLVSESQTGLSVEVALSSETEGLIRYVVHQSVSSTGTLATVGQFNPVQWGLLIYSALCIALVVLMVLDCAKRTLNARALWILLIILGHLKLYAATVDSTLSTGFRIGALLPFSKLVLYQNGAFDLALFLPVGAVVYFFLRKRLTEKYEKPLPPAPYTDEPLPRDPLEKVEEPREEDSDPQA